MKYHNLKSLLKCPDGEIRYINFKHVDGFIMSHKGYDFVNYGIDLLDKYPKTLWNIKGLGDYPNVRYSPKTVWKDFNPIEHWFYFKEGVYMEFEINGISSLQILNTETDESVDFGNPISVSNDIELQPDKQYILSNTVNSSIEFSCDDMKLDTDTFCKLLKPDNTTYAMMDIPTYKQARVNKKKRINKKWLKRYGYKIVMKSVKAKVLSISSDKIPMKNGAELVLEFSQEDLKTLCQSSITSNQ